MPKRLTSVTHPANHARFDVAGHERHRALSQVSAGALNPTHANNYLDGQRFGIRSRCRADLGADDYITKPFSVRELLARVRAVLRRLDESATQNYEDDQLTIDFADIRTVCNGRKIKLTNKEFSLLSVLAKSADRVVTRQHLLDSVWGYSYYGDARTLDVHIRRLRQKLEECGNCIETVVGVGYRFTGCANPARSQNEV